MKRRAPSSIFGRILLVISVFSILAGCHRSETFTVTGELPSSDYKVIYLDRLNVNLAEPFDSAKIRRGKFRISGKLDEPSFMMLRLEDQNFITLLASPGEHIHIVGDSLFLPAGYRVSGSEESALVKELDDRLRTTVHRADSVAAIYRQLQNEPGFDSIRPQLEKEYQAILDEQHRFSVNFILEHMQHLASIKALYQKMDNDNFVLGNVRDLQYMKILNDTLSQHYPQIRMVHALQSDFNREMAKYKQMQFSAMAENASTIGSFDLSLPDIEGDTIRLSDLRGKYVLLSFTASWCTNCRDEFSLFRGVYKRYHSKGLEIYQVFLDNDREAWQSTVRFEEIPWITVSDLSYPASEAASRYNVTQPPRNFLIDPEGNIIATNLRGKALQIKMDQIFP